MRINELTRKCLKNDISLDQALILKCLVKKDTETIKKMFKSKAKVLSLLKETPDKFFLSRGSLLKEYVVSNQTVKKLFNIAIENINFLEFYNEYPIRVGNRVLRAVNPDSKLFRKHEEAYLKKIKSKENHEKAVKATKAFVEKQRVAGKLQFLPNMQTVINNNTWEQWDIFMYAEAEDTWNTQEI